MVRRVRTGYEVLNTAVAGDLSSYGFTIDQDTDLRFNWKTEYALVVSNNLSGSAGGLSSTAAGNPEPVVQKHWVVENTISTAFIDGVIPSPNANEYGTRYRNTGYVGTGAAAPAGAGAGPGGNRAGSRGPPRIPARVRVVDGRVLGSLRHRGHLLAAARELVAAVLFQPGGRRRLDQLYLHLGELVLRDPGPRPRAGARGKNDHFAFVKDPQQWTIYYDGTVVATQLAPGAVDDHQPDAAGAVL